MRLTCKTDQAQTPPILVNTACLYPDNTHTHNQEWTFYCVKCVKVHHWKLWLSWDGYCFRSSENASMITVTYLSLSLSGAQRCVLWPLYSCTGGVWWKRPPESSDSAFHTGFISEWSSIGVVYSGCGRRITSLRGRATFSGKPAVWGQLSESRRHRQTQFKIGFSKWIKLSYSEAGR